MGNLRVLVFTESKVPILIPSGVGIEVPILLRGGHKSRLLEDNQCAHWKYQVSKGKFHRRSGVRRTGDVLY